MPKRRQKVSCKKTTGTVASKKKKKTEEFNIEDTDEIIEAEAERFLLLFEKAFHEYHEKSLKEENIDCEDRVVTDFLTKVAKKSKNTFCQMVKVVRQQSS